MPLPTWTRHYSAGRFVQLPRAWHWPPWARAFPARLHLRGGLRQPACRHRRPFPAAWRAVPCSAAVGPLIRVAAAASSTAVARLPVDPPSVTWTGASSRGSNSSGHRQYIMIHHHDGFAAYVLLAANRDSRGPHPGPVDGFQVVQLGTESTDSDHKETRITRRILRLRVPVGAIRVHAGCLDARRACCGSHALRLTRSGRHWLHYGGTPRVVTPAICRVPPRPWRARRADTSSRRGRSARWSYPGRLAPKSICTGRPAYQTL